MKDLYIVFIFKSHYCKIIFLILLPLVYLLVPEGVFFGWFKFLGIVFVLSFALILTCMIRDVKEKVVSHKKNKTGSLFGIIAAAIGLSALQVCTVGAPVCGATIGLAFLSSILPAFAFKFLYNYAIWIILLSLGIQFISFYKMKCFVNVSKKC